MATESDTIAALQRRLADVERVCAEAYQFAGAVGAPEAVLDNLSAAADGLPIPHESFLPIAAEDCDAVRELHVVFDHVRQALDSAVTPAPDALDAAPAVDDDDADNLERLVHP